MNPLNAGQLSRLRAAVKFSRSKLEPFRKNRFKRLQQFVGSNYSDGGPFEKVPLNFLELAVGIYSQRLAANAPRVLFISEHAELKPDAYKLTLATDHLMREIQLDRTLQAAVLGALFGVGIVKVGIAPAGTVEVLGVTHDVCQPFADAISLDSWVHDVNARAFEKVQFCGDQYELPLDYVMDSKDFDEKARAGLRPSDAREANPGEPKARNISRSEDRADETYRDMVRVEDLWLPMDNLLVTLLSDRDSGPPLRIVEWDGPETGPYRLLGFREVLDNIMPLSPTALWMDMHELANALYRKLGRQAERQKDLTVYRGAAKADAQREVDANDGETIQSDHPDGVRTVKRGGADPATLAFLLQTKGLFTYLAGNLDMLGGLAPQSETLGQDELLSQSAGNRLDDMRAKTEVFAGGVIYDLAKYLYNDPTIELPLVKRVAGTDLELPVTSTPEERRESDFMEYNFKVIPYSMQHISPSQRLVVLQGLLTQFLVPMMPMLQEQGIALNVEALVKKWGKYAGIGEDLDDILTFSGPPQEPALGVIGRNPRGGGATPNMPTQTKRTYERVNRPGATPGNADAQLAQLLMGGRMQPAEAEGAFRQAS